MKNPYKYAGIAALTEAGCFVALFALVVFRNSVSLELRLATSGPVEWLTEILATGSDVAALALVLLLSRVIAPRAPVLGVLAALAGLIYPLAALLEFALMALVGDRPGEFPMIEQVLSMLVPLLTPVTKGLWLTLVSIAGLKSKVLSVPLAVFGLFAGLIGLANFWLTDELGAEFLATVLRLGWIVWLGVFLLRQGKHVPQPT